MVLRLSAYLKSAGKGNVFHFLHFNAIFNLFVLSRQRHRQGQGQRLQSFRAPELQLRVQLQLSIGGQRMYSSLIGISWLAALDWPSQVNSSKRPRPRMRPTTPQLQNSRLGCFSSTSLKERGKGTYSMHRLYASSPWAFVIIQLANESLGMIDADLQIGR